MAPAMGKAKPREAHGASRNERKSDSASIAKNGNGQPAQKR